MPAPKRTNAALELLRLLRAREGVDFASPSTAATGWPSSTGAPPAALDSVSDGTTTVSPASSLVFDGNDFDVTDGGSGEADVVIAAPTAISPTQLAADTDNWNPTGLDGADIIRASTDASHNLTGIVAPAAMRAIVLENIGSFDLVLIHDATSTAANRFYCPSSTDLTVGTNTAVLLVYDATSARWRVVGGTGTSSTTAVLPLTAVVDGEPVLVWDENNSLIGAA